MSYERIAGLGTVDLNDVLAKLGASVFQPIGMPNPSSSQITSECPPGKWYQSARCEGCGGSCVPIPGYAAPAATARPDCSSYTCPTGQTKVNQTSSYVGAAAQSSLAARQALTARGCTIAPCSQGVQLIDGSGQTTYCCPRQPEQPATLTPAPPPPPSIVYTTPVRQTVQGGHGPLFWIGLGCVGVGLVLVLRRK